MATVKNLIESTTLVVCVGPGGVGKTSIAAAIGVKAAMSGRRVLVLTIDPAKRLADALGLTLGDEEREVSLAGMRSNGSLHAAMFDLETGMAALMGRLSDDPIEREKILQNRVYRAMAGSLARSHAYLAMERLHVVLAQGRYDLVVLDTPPARNALEILDAPGRLSEFLEEGVVQWFVRGREVKGLRGLLLSGSGSAAQKLFGAVVGRTLLEETLAFFEAFYRLRHGFRARAAEIQAVLRDPATAFVLVSSVGQGHLDDAGVLFDGLVERGVTPASAIFNRAYDPLDVDPERIVTDPGPADATQRAARLSAAGVEGASPERVLETLTALEALRRERALANAAALQRIGGLRARFPAGCDAVLVPRFPGEVIDLPGLDALGTHLLKGEGMRA